LITFQIENWSECVDEVAQLVTDHWREVANDRDKIPLDPDWEKYRNMDKAGILVLMTVRDDGVMVGYSLFVVMSLTHYKSNTVAMNDIIYVHPKYRGPRVGMRFIEFCHKELAQSKVHRICWHIKPVNNWTPILLRMGYRVEEYVVGICLI